MSENFFSDLQSKIESTDLLLNEAEDFSFDVPEEAKSASKDDVQLGSKDPSDEERKDYDPTKDPEVSDLIDNDDDEDEDDYEDDDEEALEDAVEDNDPAHESLDNIIESVVGKTFDTELMDKINSVYNESVLNLNTRTNEMIDYIIEGYNGLLEGDELMIEGLLQENNSFDSLFNNELLNESPINPIDAWHNAKENRVKTTIVALGKIVRRKCGKNVKVKYRKANLAGGASEYAIPMLTIGPISGALIQSAFNKVWTFYVEKGGREIWKKSYSLPRGTNAAEAAKAIEDIANKGSAKVGNQTIHEGIGFFNFDEELFTYVENDEGGVSMLFDESLLEDEYGFYDETDAMDSILESNDVDFMTEDTDSWLYEAEDETAEDEDGSLEEDFWMEAEDEEEDLEEATPVAIQADQAADFDPLSSLKSMDESWFDEEDETAEDEDGSLEEDFWMEAEDEEEDLEEAWYFEDDDEDSDDDDEDSDDDDDDEDDDDKKDKDDDEDDDEDDKDDDKKNESYYDFDFGW